MDHKGNAFVPFERTKILSFVFGHLIRITRNTIAKAIECQDIGASVDDCRINYDFDGNHIHLFLDIINQVWGFSYPLILCPTFRVWFQVLLTNFRPRET